MKPKDLIFASKSDSSGCSSIKEKVPFIEEHIFYLPEKESVSFSFPGWNNSQTFAQKQPLHVEYCSGNGKWIVAQALLQPTINWIAVEKKLPRVRKIWAKMRNAGVSNLLIVWGEAFQFTQSYLLDGSIEKIYINFPDPWPKNRHAGHRLMQKPFVKELARTLEPKGELFFVTDDPAYSEWTLRVMEQTGDFAPLFPYPHYLHAYPGYGSSYFEEFWRAKGKEIRYHGFSKGFLKIANRDCSSYGD